MASRTISAGNTKSGWTVSDKVVARMSNSLSVLRQELGGLRRKVCNEDECGDPFYSFLSWLFELVC